MKVLHPVEALGIATVALVVAGLVLVPRFFDEEEPVRRGGLAAGIASDGALVIRSTLCSGVPVPVTVAHGTPNASGVRSLPEVPAAVDARVELPATLGDRTALTITAPELDALVVTPAQWKALTQGRWLVASAPESRDTVVKPGAGLHAWTC